MRKLKGNWIDIFNGFSVALDVKKMFAGFVGLLFTLVIIGLIPVFTTIWWIYPGIKNSSSSLSELYLGSINAILAGTWWKVYLFATVLYFLLLVVWSYFGGIITRIAAVNITKDEGLEFKKALAFTNKKHFSFFSPFIFAILGFLFFFLCNFIGGLVGLIPYAGEIVVALFLPFAILSGFIMAFILIGFIFGSSLFYPTIAVESSDAFDAVSRSFQYIFAEPWRYIWYCLVAKVYGILTTAFVWVFGLLMVHLALLAGAKGMGVKFHEIISLTGISCCSITPPADPSITYKISAFIIMVWLVLVTGLIISYAISYCFSASTIIYLLLRKKVDDIEMTEIYTEESQESDLTAMPQTSSTPTTETPQKDSAEDKPSTTS
ncbi:MAG: hypothetical protein V1709_09135 [Planctomycetota bacterium]